MVSVPFPFFCFPVCKKWKFGGLSGYARDSQIEVVEG